MGIISDLSQIGLSVVKTFYKDFLDFCDNELVFISVFDRMTKKADKEKYFIKIMQKIQNQNVLFIDDEVNNIESAKKLDLIQYYLMEDILIGIRLIEI